jgi:methyltransferase (TIGR00027 family)
MFRAWESSRSDPLFMDPFADRLAGERGHAMAEETPAIARSGWSFSARTKLIDDLIVDCLDGGCDRVLNLAAGLDARPYRLAVPEALCWVEADLPAIIEEKEQKLAGEQPRCTLMRRSVDLADGEARGRFLAEQLTDARRPLVITEGVLPYLADDQVRAISADLAASGVTWWVTDMMSRIDVRVSRWASREQLACTPIQFGPKNGVQFFAPEGWTATDTVSVLKAASGFGRLPRLLRPLCWLPDGVFGSSVVRLARGSRLA